MSSDQPEPSVAAPSLPPQANDLSREIIRVKGGDRAASVVEAVVDLAAAGLMLLAAVASIRKLWSVVATLWKPQPKNPTLPH